MAGSVDALVPGFGSKRTLAAAIAGLLGPHTYYCEPFALSFAVVFAKEPSRTEVLNDLHAAAVNVALVAADDVLAPRLAEKLARTAFCETLYLDALAWLCDRPEPAPPGPDLEHAYRYLVASWQGRNGFAGTEREQLPGFCVRWSDTGGDPAARWRAVAASVPRWWERLRRATILCRDGFEVLGNLHDRPGVAVYADPPYLRKSVAYRHDFRPEDHARLAQALNRFRAARVVVSYYDAPELVDLYPLTRWRRVCPGVKKNLSAPSGKVADAGEVLLVNGAAGP